jgi:septal ring factor EnvC (AmiA/AmiB activator)
MATETPTRSRSRAAAPDPAPSADQLVSDAQQKAIDVLLQKRRWTGRRLHELEREIAAVLRRHDRLTAEMAAVDAERAALADAIRQLGGDPDAEPTH